MALIPQLDPYKTPNLAEAKAGMDLVLANKLIQLVGDQRFIGDEQLLLPTLLGNADLEKRAKPRIGAWNTPGGTTQRITFQAELVEHPSVDPVVKYIFMCLEEYFSNSVNIERIMINADWFEAAATIAKSDAILSTFTMDLAGNVYSTLGDPDLAAKEYNRVKGVKETKEGDDTNEEGQTVIGGKDNPLAPFMRGITPMHEIYTSVAHWLRTSSIGMINDSSKIDRIMESLFSISWAMGDKINVLYIDYLLREAGFTADQIMTVHSLFESQELDRYDFLSAVNHDNYSADHFKRVSTVNRILGKSFGGRHFFGDIVSDIAQTRRRIAKEGTGTVKQLYDRRDKNLGEEIREKFGVSARGAFYGRQYLYSTLYRDLGQALRYSGKETKRPEEFVDWVFKENATATTWFNGILEHIYNRRRLEGPQLYPFRSSIHGVLAFYCPAPGVFGLDVILRKAQEDVSLPQDQRLYTEPFLISFAEYLIALSGPLKSSIYSGYWK